MLWSSPHGKPPPLPPRQTALRVVTGSSPAYHHLSRAFFYLPFQLQIMATPWARTPPGSRDPQQPEHLFPFSWGVVGFPPEQMGLELSHDFCECGQGKEEEKKKKHDYTRTSFISVHSRQKEKKTIQEQDVPSLKALSPLPLSIVVSFLSQSEIA